MTLLFNCTKADLAQAEDRGRAREEPPIIECALFRTQWQTYSYVVLPPGDQKARRAPAFRGAVHRGLKSTNAADIS
jgi:hypothetical protein